MIFVKDAGLEWPLETYLDAFGFARVEPGNLPDVAESYVMLKAVDREGQLHEGEGRDLPWADLVGYRTRDGGRFVRCEACGDFVDEVFETGFCTMCADCLEYGERDEYEPGDPALDAGLDIGR